MKRVVSIVCVVMLLASVLMLSGCGLDGTYRSVQIIKSNGNVEMDSSMTLVVEGNMALYSGNGSSGTYYINKDTKTVMISGESCPYELDGKRLTIYIDGYRYIFEKQ